MLLHKVIQQAFNCISARRHKILRVAAIECSAPWIDSPGFLDRIDGSSVAGTALEHTHGRRENCRHCQGAEDSEATQGRQLSLPPTPLG